MSVKSRKKPQGDVADVSQGWLMGHFGADAEVPPFSFVYDGRPSASLLGTWRSERASEPVDGSRSKQTLMYTDPETGLEVRCEILEYEDFPATEWIVYFRNGGEHDTPILEDIQTLDVSLALEQAHKWSIIHRPSATYTPPDAADHEFVLHHSLGSLCHTEDFRPLESMLGPGERLRIGTPPHTDEVPLPPDQDGSPSVSALPFFNLEWPGGGMIAGIGWPEAWGAQFLRDEDRSLDVRVGMRESHFFLRPEERVRMPRMLTLFWDEDRIRGHNVWRRILLDYYTPHPGGELLKGPLCHRGWGSTPVEDQIARIEWWTEHDLPMEWYWIDIGWERPPTKEEARDHLANDALREGLFPDGLRPVSDAAHANGMKFVLWFGGGRLFPRLDRVKEERPDLLSDEYPGTDCGNPKINEWLIDHVAQRIEDWGIDVFRQDTRSTPLPDSNPDRVGINSARSVEGFCEFWDAILERCYAIDNCCGGGRNIDLETISRSIALWRSDFQISLHFDPIGMQGQTHVLSMWMPLSTGVCNQEGGEEPDVYRFRSGYGPSMRVGWYTKEGGLPSTGFDFDAARRLLHEYVSVRDCYLGDYYPLSRYSLDRDAWMSWQFDRPDLGEGIVQAFRRPESLYEAATLALQGLDPDSRYAVTDADAGDTEERTGRSLMEEGVSITIPNRPGAVLVTYKRIG